MTLNSFSAFLEFAIHLETSGLDIAPPTTSPIGHPAAECLRRCHAETEKCLKQLRTILRENVTELVMEPCTPIAEDAFPIPPAQADPSDAWRHLLQTQHDFLREAARAVNLKEVKRALDKIATKKEALLEDLKNAAQA